MDVVWFVTQLKWFIMSSGTAKSLEQFGIQLLLSTMLFISFSSPVGQMDDPVGKQDYASSNQIDWHLIFNGNDTLATFHQVDTSFNLKEVSANKLDLAIP